MQRINNNPLEKLVFQAKGGPMNISSQCVNHGLALPHGKTLLETGLFLLGNLKTDKGRNIEVAFRKSESFAIHLVAIDAGQVENPLPIRLFPNIEITDEIIVPLDLFNPYYNCHGCTFGDSEFWINPVASTIGANGIMIPNAANLSILLEDEYEEVGIKDGWVAAVLFGNNGDILHSVKKVDNQIVSKYDGYQEITHPEISDVDTMRYGNGTFRFYKTI